MAPLRVSANAAARSDPKRIPWGANVTLHGPPPAVVLFAPHKTASTFFTTFLHDLSRLLGLCWYSDNAAFTYAPSDHAKCAAPSCGHGDGTQRAFEPSDGGWGDCASFAEAQIRVASTCTQREAVGSPGGTGAAGAAGEAGADVQSTDDACEPPPLSTINGVAWGAVRLPPAMRKARACLGTPPWHWYLLLHQRHPGDTLVSEYHSFGWSHPPPPRATAQQKAAHRARQARIRNVTVGQYVGEHLAELRRKYAPYLELLGGAEATSQPQSLPALEAARPGGAGGVTVIRSRYEELVTDFGAWLEPILAALAPSYTPQTLEMLKEALLARHSASFRRDGKHRRSITPGRYTAEVGAAERSEQHNAHREWWARLGYD